MPRPDRGRQPAAQRRRAARADAPGARPRRRRRRSPAAPSRVRSTACRSRSRTRSTRPASSRRPAPSAGAIACRNATRPSWRASGRRAGILRRQDQHARVHLGQRDRQRRLRPDVEPVRPGANARAAAAAARRRSSRPAARRSTSAATAATASASPRTCAAWPGSSRPAVASRGPGTRPGRAACSSRSRSSGRSRGRVEDLELLLPIIAGPDGEDPHVVPVRLGDPALVDVGGARASPGSATTASGRRRPRRSRPSIGRSTRIRATGARVRGARSSGHRGRAPRMGGGGPGRRLRVAVAAHRTGGHARAWLVRPAGLGHGSCRASRSRATS